MAAAVLAVAAIGFFVWQHLHAAPLTDKDVLVLADFKNTTGEAVFDNTLREALSVQLEQSPFLKILSNEQTRRALRFMGHRCLLPESRNHPEFNCLKHEDWHPMI